MSPEINPSARRWNTTPDGPILPGSSIRPGLSLLAEGMVQEFTDRQPAPEVRDWITRQAEEYPPHWPPQQRDQAARLDLIGWQRAGLLPPRLSGRLTAAAILWHIRQEERAARAFTPSDHPAERTA